MTDSSNFEKLFQATYGQTVELNDACGVTTTKIKNRKFGQFNAVDYIQDGSNPPQDCARDIIGYEHIVLIKTKDNNLIKFTNGAKDRITTTVQDPIFEQVLSTLSLN